MSSTFARASSGGASAAAFGLACAPRKNEALPAPARVQNRLRELQALCTPECEALLFVAGASPSFILRCRTATGLQCVQPLDG